MFDFNSKPTKREKKVIDFINRRHYEIGTLNLVTKYKTIAEALFLTEKEVENLLKSIQKKLLLEIKHNDFNKKEVETFKGIIKDF